MPTDVYRGLTRFQLAKINTKGLFEEIESIRAQFYICNYLCVPHGYFCPIFSFHAEINNFRNSNNIIIRYSTFLQLVSHTKLINILLGWTDDARVS